MLAYYRTKFEEVCHNYDLALYENDPDGVHDLRVALKRLRAFFTLAECINRRFNARKQFKNFKRISRNTGALRDTQVQRNLVEKLNTSLHLDLTAYFLFLDNREAGHIREFQIFSLMNPIKGLNKAEKDIQTVLGEILGRFAEANARELFDNLRGELYRLSGERELKEEILHEIRKLAKQTHYTLEVIQAGFEQYTDAQDFVKGIKKVHQALGRWHDLDVSLLFLDEFLERNGGAHPLEPYSQLKEHIQREKEALNKKFRTVFDAFRKTIHISSTLSNNHTLPFPLPVGYRNIIMKKLR